MNPMFRHDKYVFANERILSKYIDIEFRIQESFNTVNTICTYSHRNKK